MGLLAEMQAVAWLDRGGMVNPIMPTTEDVWRALEAVMDPEIPVISVVDMGIVRAVEMPADGVVVTMTPTFSGCPALDVMRRDIETAARSGDRASPSRRSYIRRGARVDQRDGAGEIAPFRAGPALDTTVILPPSPSSIWPSALAAARPSPPCAMPSAPSLCRMIWYCNECRTRLSSLRPCSSFGLPCNDGISIAVALWFHSRCSTTAHTLSLKVIFVTDNERAFARVSGLKLADWAERLRPAYLHSQRRSPHHLISRVADDGCMDAARTSRKERSGQGAGDGRTAGRLQCFIRGLVVRGLPRPAWRGDAWYDRCSIASSCP